MTTNMELTKAKKNITVVKNVFKVAKIVALVLVGLFFVLAIIAEIFGPDIFRFGTDSSASLTVAVRIFDLKLSNNFSEGIGKHYVAGYCLGIGIAIGLLAVICEYIESIFKVILEGESIFTEKALKKMKTGFILFTVLTLLETSVLATVFVGLILWSVYTLFKYACVLQKESDETL